MAARSASIFSRDIVVSAIRDAFPKLDPRQQIRNPVMFIVELGSVITTGIFLLDLVRGDTDGLWFVAAIAVWLWLTVLFANFAEAIAESRGKAQAETLRAARTTTLANRRTPSGELEQVQAPDLQRGDVVVVVAGESIPADGDVIEGVGIRGRVRHHRRVGARDPRGGRRPLGRHRWHPPAVRPVAS